VRLPAYIRSGYGLLGKRPEAQLLCFTLRVRRQRMPVRSRVCSIVLSVASSLVLLLSMLVLSGLPRDYLAITS